MGAVPEKVMLVSLGCDKNLVDSEMMLGCLAEAGFTLCDAPEEAEFLSEIVEKVIYVPMNKQLPSERDNIEILSGKPVRITGDKSVSALVTDSGEREVSCVFVLRAAVAPDKLIPGVETEGAHIKVDLMMKTNLPGLFACGDIAGKPYQYVKAAGQGNVAALSAVAYLNGLK